MTEDIQPEVLRKTQETLGKFIKKPVLSEKLLRKPPFRFLHDICTSAMKETGFFEGTLSGNDIKIELINDKEGKIAFLQKVIAAVESANNVKLAVKPNKIVAGHEPLKTNEFLQALAFALEKQIETNTPKKPLKKSKVTKPENKEGDTVKRKNTINKGSSKSGNDAGSEVTKKDPSKKKPSEKKPESDLRKKKIESENVKTKKKIEKTVSVENEVPLSNGTDLTHVEAKFDVVEETKPVTNAETVLDESDNLKSNRPPSAKLKKRTPSAKPASTDKISENPLAHSEGSDNDEVLDRVLGGVINDVQVKSPDPPPNISPPPASPTPLKPVETVPSAKPVTRNKSGAINSESVAAPRPRTAIRPPSARPASARPAAPRIRDRGQVPLQEEVTPAIGKVNLIVEQENGQDDEELVYVKTEQDNTELLVEQTKESLVDDPTEHGQLVSQILVAQKELEEDSFTKKNVSGHTEIEWNTGRNIDGTRREVDRLRTAVQTLTRAANPLGKLLEYLQEDVDSMQHELNSWKERNISLSTKLEQERSLTDKSIEPLKAHLEELDHSIHQELEQIGILKATLIRNDDKIKRLLIG